MRNLFRPPSEALRDALQAALHAITAATPLSAAHEEKLPHAVRELSALLTQDRAHLASSYWVHNRLLTAYCRYFLPWNLFRLSWLLPGLELPMTPNATILDLGSGPLTMPIALWLTRPDWREMPLRIICADVSPGPLALGKEIWQRLAPDSPWEIELRRGPLENILRGFPDNAMLICAANVLNETKPTQKLPLRSRLASLTRAVAARLAPMGRFLAVEPGTRLGGKLMAITRLAAFGANLVPEAPCPHWGPCPMLAEDATGWCHFSHTTDAVPHSLTTLSRKAGFAKQSVSLSCLLLRNAAPDEVRRAVRHLPPMADAACDWDDDGSEDADAWATAFAASVPAASPAVVRILSDPIRLPGHDAPARYGCAEKGLVLVHDALRLPSGAAVAVRWPTGDARDAKSGALILTAPEHRQRNRAPRATARKTPPPPRSRRPSSGRPAAQNAAARKGRQDTRGEHER